MNILFILMAVLSVGDVAWGQRAQKKDTPLTISVADTKREFYFYHPKPRSKKVPLILLFHGGYGGAERMRFAVNEQDAELGGYAVAYPQARGFWQDGRNSTGGLKTDDLDFIQRLIGQLVAKENVDPKRIYAAGLSGGGMFVLRLACELTDKFAAYATVAASFPEEYISRCDPKQPISLLMINGTDDQIIKEAGGYFGKGSADMGQTDYGATGTTVSVKTTLNFWRNVSGCERKNKEKKYLPDRVLNDGTKVKEIVSRKCKNDTEVRYLKIEGGGHHWPGRPLPQRKSRIQALGNRTSHVDGAEKIWSFFKDRKLAN